MIPLGLSAIFRTIEVIGYKQKIKIPELINWVNMLFFCFGIILLLLEFILVVNAKTRNYEKKKYYEDWRQVIERVVSVGGVDKSTIKEVYQYNAEIEIQRYYIDNPWTNWFASRTIASQPLIDLEELKGGINIYKS